MGHTDSRPVRHQAEQQGWSILLSPCWATPCRRIGLKVRYISPVACSSQDDPEGGAGHSHLSVMASKRVVFPGFSVPYRPASVTRGQLSSPGSKRSPSAQPARTQLSHLETQEISLQSGFDISCSYHLCSS